MSTCFLNYFLIWTSCNLSLFFHCCNSMPIPEYFQYCALYWFLANPHSFIPQSILDPFRNLHSLFLHFHSISRQTLQQFVLSLFLLLQVDPYTSQPFSFHLIPCRTLHISFLPNSLLDLTPNFTSSRLVFTHFDPSQNLTTSGTLPFLFFWLPMPNLIPSIFHLSLGSMQNFTSSCWECTRSHAEPYHFSSLIFRNLRQNIGRIAVARLSTLVASL
jgi:hypothetical protein